jgi:hypothetical protein
MKRVLKELEPERLKYKDYLQYCLNAYIFSGNQYLGILRGFDSKGIYTETKSIDDYTSFDDIDDENVSFILHKFPFHTYAELPRKKSGTWTMYEKECMDKINFIRRMFSKQVITDNQKLFPDELTFIMNNLAQMYHYDVMNIHPQLAVYFSEDDRFCYRLTKDIPRVSEGTLSKYNEGKYTFQYNDSKISSGQYVFTQAEMEELTDFFQPYLRKKE